MNSNTRGAALALAMLVFILCPPAGVVFLAVAVNG